ncbi:MAG: outer membrane lipoprotein-sorting protein [Cellvibrionaceae bacterium]
MKHCKYLFIPTLSYSQIAVMGLFLLSGYISAQSIPHEGTGLQPSTPPPPNPISSFQADTQNVLTSAKAIIQAAIDNWRGVNSSYSEMTMIIHRPDWERSMSMHGWTKGDKHSLVRVVAPKKDAGNGTLLVDNDMWTYSPKINRVIKMPSSMMGQSWMGSDFSNKDVSRADDILVYYDHELIKTEVKDGHTVYSVQATPKEDAAVVWGKEVLQVRDDFVLLQHDFYDQDDVLFKVMKTQKIAVMDERVVAVSQRIAKIETPEEWTEIHINDIDFDVDINPRMFTQSYLRNPR